MRWVLRDALFATEVFFWKLGFCERIELHLQKQKQTQKKSEENLDNLLKKRYAAEVVLFV